MKYIASIAIILLIAIVGIGGYMFFSQKSGNRQRTQRQTAPARQSPQVDWKTSLSDEKRAMYNIPGPNASEEEKKRHSDLVVKNTSTGSELNILRACQPSPLSLSVDNTLSFTVRNRDTVAHTLKIGTDKTYALAPGTTSTVTLEKKATILGYGCDSYDQVGFLVTAP